MHFLLPMPMLSFLNFINNNKEHAEPSGSCSWEYFCMVLNGQLQSDLLFAGCPPWWWCEGLPRWTNYLTAAPTQGNPEEESFRVWEHRGRYSNSPSWLEEASLIYSTVSPDHRQNTSMTTRQTASLQKAAGSFHSEPPLLTYQTELQIDWEPPWSAGRTGLINLLLADEIIIDV